MKLLLLSLCLVATEAFVFQPRLSTCTRSSTVTELFAEKGEDGEGETAKAAVMVNGEELEKMLTEWDTPLVVDAYATWCGPCLLMAPEFEQAAKDLEGKVRFVKLDTDKNEVMASRLNIMGLPTLLFMDQYTPEEGAEEKGDAKAVLKGRIEGALRKQNILDLCDHYFFGAPEPQL
jgi:thioredoxin